MNDVLKCSNVGQTPVRRSTAVNLAYVARTIKGLKCIKAHEMRFKGALNRCHKFFL